VAGLLTKPQTITAADAICARYKSKLSSVPTPKSETDYPGIKANLVASFGLAQKFFPEITVLIDKSVDSAELHSKWIDVDKADFDATKAAGDKLIEAITSNDHAAIGPGLAGMEGVPDHTAEIAPYLKAYGFIACYDLENS